MTDGDKSGNGMVPAKVMHEVMDKFVSLVEQNNKNYNSMVGAVETLAANQITLTDKVNSLERAIDDEQLSDVMTEANAEVQNSVIDIKKSISNCAMTNLAFVSGVSQHFSYLNIDPKKFAEAVNGHVHYDYLAGDLRKNFEAFMRFVSFARQRTLLFVFVVGVVVGPIVLDSGMSIFSVIKDFLK